MEPTKHMKKYQNISTVDVHLADKGMVKQWEWAYHHVNEDPTWRQEKCAYWLLALP
uniref:Uncharacterized protein n=1 Tax=Hyaloperonospora arabidopsidis (strain Emoy2) TaxID=559515 RepID=M4BFS6_HYAAE